MCFIMFYRSRMTNTSHQCLYSHYCYFPQEPNEVLQCKYSTFSWVSELLFQTCIQTQTESLQDSLWGRMAEGTGHCKCRVCSPLWSWGKQQPTSSGNFIPGWGLCILASAVGEWLERSGSNGYGLEDLLLFIAKNSHTKANLIPC